ncbi:hypothetical protein OTK49_02035 [Vibrio coralliirubri]|uniref:hypothetical protein n=1 Tax=Vibrio coralliirubri TaxID=1516159 RepID=UPI0022837BB1|nr:hypothetical protein [Vibrio coralliirubri]MCY9861294.1 hypothetical protein [Vibrio coralliirubri]
MSKTEQFENLVEDFASAINAVRLPTNGFFGVDVASSGVAATYEKLIASGAEISLLIQAGQAEQYFAFQLDLDLSIKLEYILGADFTYVPESVVDKQMSQLELDNRELFLALMETNKQRSALVKSFANAIKDTCVPYKALSLADEPSYLTLKECIQVLSEVYGKIFICAISKEEKVVLEFREDLENADMFIYS